MAVKPILPAICFASALVAQLPPSAVLSGKDRLDFRAEVAKIELLLQSARDKGAVMYQMARTWAAAKQWPEAMNWLQKTVDSRAGFDPSRDPLFSELLRSREFAHLMAAVRAATAPVSHSSVAFRIEEGDLAPESVAYDPHDRQFYFGSMRKGKIVRCSASGQCRTFAEGLGTILGLKIHAADLWVLDNSKTRSALIRYGLRGHAEPKRYFETGAHLFNDLVVGAQNDVWLTDTRASSVWLLEPGAAELRKIPGAFHAANGIAMTPGERLVYVSTFPDGISVIDTKTHSVTPIGRPADLCLANIDGLYFHRGELIAIQNGFMSPRVIRLILSKDLRKIERFEILERRNRNFDGVTTGVIAGDDFFYMANIQDEKAQDEKASAFDPITVLKLRL